jgi:hypothetical protein
MKFLATPLGVFRWGKMVHSKSIFSLLKARQGVSLKANHTEYGYIKSTIESKRYKST